jgi:hypothetical protein
VAVDIIFEQPAVNKALEASRTSRLRFVPVSWGRLLPIMGIPSERLFSDYETVALATRGDDKERDF